MKVLLIVLVAALAFACVSGQGFGGPQFGGPGIGGQQPGPQQFGGLGFGGQGIQGIFGGAGGVSYVGPTLWGNQGPRFF